MPGLTLNSKLIGLTPASATTIYVLSGFSDITNALAAPAHLFIEVYTTQFREVMLVYKTDTVAGVPTVYVQRGMRGTLARSWPDDACFTVIETVDGAPCDPTQDNPVLSQISAQDVITILEQLTVGSGLVLDLTSVDAPKLSLAPTGVAAGTYGGAQINTFGQIVSAPVNWPASACPTFDPCGGA